MTQLQECKSRLSDLKANLLNEQDKQSRYAEDLRLTIELTQNTIKQLEFGKANPMVWVP